MKISEGIHYIGVNDNEIDLFEGQYKVPNGISYNSYVVFGEKIAVMDTSEADFSDEWMKNLEDAIGDKEPDYLIVQHMEPDHSGAITAFAEKYRNAKIVASAKAFTMMNQFFGTDYKDRQIVVGQGSTLDLGDRTLSFIPAPMVHWPEVITTYDSKDKVLFSADGFGKFGVPEQNEDWSDEARRYYIGIVGKYGAQVQTLIKKAAELDIKMICPLHGPVLDGEKMAEALRLYNIWSSYEAETDGVFIACTSIYGHTKMAAEKLYEILKERGVNVRFADLGREDMSECVAQSFRYSKLVLASPTYNSDVFPFMKIFIEHLIERNYKNRKVALIENGSWAPTAATVMTKMLSECKNLTVSEEKVTVRGSLDENGVSSLVALADSLM